jgi:hypothetical protein
MKKYPKQAVEGCGTSTRKGYNGRKETGKKRRKAHRGLYRLNLIWLLSSGHEVAVKAGGDEATPALVTNNRPWKGRD